MLGREDVVAAVILNRRLHESLRMDGKPVLFLPLTLAHTIPALVRKLA